MQITVKATVELNQELTIENEVVAQRLATEPPETIMEFLLALSAALGNEGREALQKEVVAFAGELESRSLAKLGRAINEWDAESAGEL